MSAVADTLRAAKALVGRKWCQGAMKDPEGGVCIYGALDRVLEHGAPIFGGDEPIWRELMAACDGDPIRWNDEPGRTQAEVVAAFDKAIELAEAGQ